MEIKSGHINLFSIYSYVATHPVLVSGMDNSMREYSKLVNDTVSTIPANRAGWYLWGKFNDIGFWETTYLGKAGNKITSSLKARIKEELLDERGAFWATIYGSEPTEKQAQKIYKNKYGPGTRAYRKRNVHFIVWVSVTPITEEEIKTEETVLISAFRPAVNIQRGSYPKVTQYTDSIVQAIDREVASIIVNK